MSAEDPRSEGGGDVWAELFATAGALSDTITLSLQALSPDDASADKVVSTTTKKRLLVKALQGLKQGKDNIQLLGEHLKALQAASQQWQRTMMYASKSHEELMEQLENTNRDLHLTSERLRSVEAQRLAAVREAEAQRALLGQLESERKALQAALKQRDDDLETAQFTNAELQSEVKSLKLFAENAKVAVADADQARDRAVAALDGVKAEASKAAANAERHQETVAKLTGDNLVFLMNLKKAESELAAANQERTQLKLAVEKQRGPWFDEVRASVEERVKHAMVHGEELQRKLEAARAEHSAQLQDIMGQKADLEEFVAQLRGREERIEEDLKAAQGAQADAALREAAATARAEQLQHTVEALRAENRVLQENVKGMRQECTERWVTEQAALGQVGGLKDTIAGLEKLVAQQQERGRQLEASLDTQLAINKQLMAKKEEMEWQLMAVMAKVDGGVVAGTPPLNLLVSGLLSLDRDKMAAASRQPVAAAVAAPEPPSSATNPSPLPAATGAQALLPGRLASTYYSSPSKAPPAPPLPTAAASALLPLQSSPAKPSAPVVSALSPAAAASASAVAVAATASSTLKSSVSFGSNEAAAATGAAAAVVAASPSKVAVVHPALRQSVLVQPAQADAKSAPTASQPQQPINPALPYATSPSKRTSPRWYKGDPTYLAASEQPSPTKSAPAAPASPPTTTAPPGPTPTTPTHPAATATTSTAPSPAPAAVVRSSAEFFKPQAGPPSPPPMLSVVPAAPTPAPASQPPAAPSSSPASADLAHSRLPHYMASSKDGIVAMEGGSQGATVLRASDILAHGQPQGQSVKIRTTVVPHPVHTSSPPRPVVVSALPPALSGAPVQAAASTGPTPAPPPAPAPAPAAASAAAPSVSAPPSHQRLVLLEPAPSSVLPPVLNFDNPLAVQSHSPAKPAAHPDPMMGITTASGNVVYHPAMHPALLAAPREATSTPARRISAASVATTSTPPPKNPGA